MSASRIYVQIPLTPEEALQSAASEFVRRAGVTGPDKHSEYIVRIARAFTDVENPKKAEKILRELEYDAVLMDALELRIMGYMGLRTASSSFRALWKSICKLLMRLQMQDQTAFQCLVRGIVERPVVLRTEKFYEDNFFELVKAGIGSNSSAVHDFLREAYCLNHQVGMNPSGKGEHIALLFTKDAQRASDIRTEIEYEIKTSGAPVGDNLGSKALYKESLTNVFSSKGEALDFKKVSFGSRDFAKKWSPVFLTFTVSFPDAAKEFLDYQRIFYLREISETHNTLVQKYLAEPSLENLCDVYDEICVEYVKRALGFSKGMIVFEEEPTGKFFCFQCEMVDYSVSFAGSPRSTPLKLFLPKSSATMRPEIFTNFNDVLSLQKSSQHVSDSADIRGSGRDPLLDSQNDQGRSSSHSGHLEGTLTS